MRKVNVYRRAWPHYRHPKQGYTSAVNPLEVKQDIVAVDRSFNQGCFNFLLGSRQYRATSSSYHASIQNSPCLAPSSAAVLHRLPSTSGPVLDIKASFLNVRRSLAVVSQYSSGDDHRERCRSDYYRVHSVALSDFDEGEESKSSADGTEDGIEASRSWESFYSSNVKTKQTEPRLNWIERGSPSTESARQWSLYLNGHRRGFRPHLSGLKLFNSSLPSPFLCNRLYSSDATQGVARKTPKVVDHSQRAVVVALVCNFLVFSLKVGVWFMTSSHVMLAEAVHSLADLANQALLAYGLISSRRAPDALHPYGYSRERFVWSLISAVGIFCLGCGATIVHGVQNLATAEPLANVTIAAAVIAGSMLMEGASLYVAYGAVMKGAATEGMSLREYLWRGHDPTSVAVLMEDGAACAGLAIAAMALAAAEITGNPMWDPIGSILVGNLLGVVAIFLIQRNRQALLGRSIDDVEMRRIINLLIADPVVEGLYDCKSEVIGPGEYRFKAEIDFNGVVIVQNYLQRAGRETWMQEFRKAVNNPDGSVLDRVLAEYGEEVVSAVGSEVDRLEKDIQKLVPGIRHVDIEAHNPNGLRKWAKVVPVDERTPLDGFIRLPALYLAKVEIPFERKTLHVDVLPPQLPF